MALSGFQRSITQLRAVPPVLPPTIEPVGARVRKSGRVCVSKAKRIRRTARVSERRQKRYRKSRARRRVAEV
eukprot:1194746-Prorocentrum_minimum.AAC.7